MHDSIQCPQENKTAAAAAHSKKRKKRKNPNEQTNPVANVKPRDQELKCKLSHLKRFSLYLDQRSIYLQTLNECCLLICQTDN